MIYHSLVHRTRIKICGITRPADVLAAAEAGADAVGIVRQAASKRFVREEATREIIGMLPPYVCGVGLFVDAEPGEIVATAGRLGLSFVQLHGNESPEVVAAVAPLRVIKAIHVTGQLGDELDRWRQAASTLKLTNLSGLLLDAHADVPGGSGVANDWDLIGKHLTAGDLRGLPRWVAAGGLTPQNVGDVVRQLHPWAVDVSSGVEARPREKSPELIKEFVQAVRLAEAG
jgi:phosphoribosylanthranilate isomerase